MKQVQPYWQTMMKIIGFAGIVITGNLVSPMFAVESLDPVASAIQFELPPIPDRSRPGRRVSGGGSRGCGTSSQLPLTALIPSSKGARSSSPTDNNHSNDEEQAWSVTTQSHPSLLFYVPYTLTPDIALEFVLLDEHSQLLSKHAFTATLSPGVIRLAWPDSLEPLELGESYHWYFLVYCDAEDPEFVEGWIDRRALDPGLRLDIQQSSPREQIFLYTAHGIWQDAIAQLAALRQTHPSNLELVEDWETLLGLVGLDDIAATPLVDCCIDSALSVEKGIGNTVNGASFRPHSGPIE